MSMIPGWQLVPAQPTPEMIAAGRQARQDGYSEVAIFDAMLAATPPPPRDAGREWQPIETAPKDEYVLVSCGPGGMIEACQPTEFVGKQYTWIDSYGNPVVGPEHWMPLPVPPRAPTGEKGT